MHGLEVAADCLGDERSRPINPCGNPGRTAARYVAAKARRDFDAGIDLPIRKPFFQIRIIRERRFFDKVRGAAQFFEIGAAFVTVVVIEDGEGQRVDVGGDAKAEDQHQKRRAEQSEADADGIAQQLQGFADGAGYQAPQAEG